MVFGGAEELGAESKRAEGGGGEVASLHPRSLWHSQMQQRKRTQSLQEMEFVAALPFEEVWSQT